MWWSVHSILLFLEILIKASIDFCQACLFHKFIPNDKAFFLFYLCQVEQLLISCRLFYYVIHLVIPPGESSAVSWVVDESFLSLPAASCFCFTFSIFLNLARLFWNQTWEIEYGVLYQISVMYCYVRPILKLNKHCLIFKWTSWIQSARANGTLIESPKLCQQKWADNLYFISFDFASLIASLIAS